MLPVLTFCLLLAVQSAPDLTDRLDAAEIAAAIELGKRGTVPIVKVTRILGDYDLLIAGPVARIASAAHTAERLFRPFAVENVRPENAAREFVISAHEKEHSSPRARVRRIVPQPHGATGTDATIQPIREDGTTSVFRELPKGTFQIVVVRDGGPQRYTVSAKDRERIR